MDRRRTLSLALGAFGAAFGARLVSAQTSGSAIRIVFSLGPGAAGDVLTRLVADGLAAALGRPVLVENRVGADGRIAINFVKNAPPTGEVLMSNTGPPMWLLPMLVGKSDYDAYKDFAPITILGHFDFCIAVANNTGVKTLAELTEWMKAHPDKRTYAVLALGSIQHFAGTRLAKVIGVEMVHVLYKGGAQAIGDLIAGQIPVYISSVGDAAEQHRAGTLRVVAVASKVRSPFLPDVPTVRESGFDLVAQSWYGLWAPAGTPAPFIKQLHDAIVEYYKKPEVQTRIAALGYTPGGATPDEMLADMKAQAALWEPVIKETGFHLDH